MPRKAKDKPKQHGAGSTYQDNKGQWWAQIYAEGRRIARRAKSKEGAEQILAGLAERRDAGIDFDGAAQTVETFMAYWLDKIKTPEGITPKTRRHYRQMIDLYIDASLGLYRLDAIRAADILVFKNSMLASTTGNTPLHAWRVLSQALDKAVALSYITENPCKRIGPPKVQVMPKDALTPEQFVAFLHYARRTTHKGVAVYQNAALYDVAGILGLRLGELLGLRWIDVSFERAELQVRQQVLDIDGKVFVQDMPKTDAGRRTLPLPPLLLARLREQWIQTHANALVFPNEVGKPNAQRNQQRQFEAIRDAVLKEGETKYTMHQLRHTASSRLAEEGANEFLVKQFLGHANSNVTQRYVHIAVGAIRPYLEAIEKQYF